MEKKRRISAAQRRANDKYDAAHYDLISVKLPKGYKQQILAMGYSVNGFIVALVKASLESK